MISYTLWLKNFLEGFQNSENKSGELINLTLVTFRHFVFQITYHLMKRIIHVAIKTWDIDSKINVIPSLP